MATLRLAMLRLATLKSVLSFFKPMQRRPILDYASALMEAEPHRVAIVIRLATIAASLFSELKIELNLEHIEQFAVHDTPNER